MHFKCSHLKSCIDNVEAYIEIAVIYLIPVILYVCMVVLYASIIVLSKHGGNKISTCIYLFLKAYFAGTL